MVADGSGDSEYVVLGTSLSGPMPGKEKQRPIGGFKYTPACDKASVFNSDLFLMPSPLSRLEYHLQTLHESPSPGGVSEGSPCNEASPAERLRQQAPQPGSWPKQSPG